MLRPKSQEPSQSENEPSHHSGPLGTSHEDGTATMMSLPFSERSCTAVKTVRMFWNALRWIISSSATGNTEAINVSRCTATTVFPSRSVMLVDHDYLASVIFMVWWSGFPFSKALSDFYPSLEVGSVEGRDDGKNSKYLLGNDMFSITFKNGGTPRGCSVTTGAILSLPKLTGNVDDLLHVGIGEGVIVPCLTWQPRTRGTYMAYWLLHEQSNHPSSKESMFFYDSARSSWHNVLDYLLHRVDPILVPLISLVEYLSLPPCLENDAKDIVPSSVPSTSIPKELNLMRIRVRYPMISPLLPRLIQYHEMLVTMLQSS